MLEDKCKDVLPIKGFQEVSMMEWDGVVSSILFIGGCNFRCPYCHNFNIAFSTDSIETIPEEAVFERLFELKKWVEGVVISGGEPTLYKEELVAFLKKLKKRNLKIKLYTNGSNSDILELLIKEKLVDAISMDIKHSLDMYNVIANSNIKDVAERVRQSVNLLKASEDISVKFRLTVVKGVHDRQHISELKHFVAPKKLILQNVSSDHIPEGSKDKIIPFKANEFEELQKILDLK